MISPDTFARYSAMRVPRYTSYPTAPNFKPADSDADYRGWLGELAPQDPLSLYFHVPFCREMCWYCGCHTTVARREAPIRRYVAVLDHEIMLVSEQTPERLTVKHLHWGGGSPTLLPADAIRDLDRRIRRGFDIAADAEIAVEVDPRTLTPECAAAFANAGVNRASIGVQSFDPAVQLAINRSQSFEVTSTAVAALRRVGIERINFDLLYGLPRQTIRSCLSTVEQALRLCPDRLAVFGYAHVPAMKPHQRKIDEQALPDAAERVEQAQAVSEALLSAGYRPVGLDHFALPGDELVRAATSGRLHRNFQGYTVDPCRTLIGFGASAISRMPQGFVQNAVRIPDYQHLVLADRLPTARLCRINAEDAQRAAIIERLMCDYRAEIGDLSPIALDRLERDGLVRRHGSSIEVPPGARPLVRAVAAAFDAYLPQTTARHVTAV